MAVGRQYANNCWGTLSSGISAGATSLSYTLGANATPFPVLTAGQTMDITITNAAGLMEIVSVTATGTNTFSTMVRAQESTTARSWSSGDRVGLRLTAASLNAFLQANNSALTGTTTAQRIDMSGPINQKHGADIPSFATIDLGAATGNLVDVTGTTGITAITLPEGFERTVRFTGILTLTNSTNLVLPGGIDIITAAGDFATFRGYAGGVVRCSSYTKASNRHGADIASAVTINLEASPGDMVDVTGTTTITGITLLEGHERTVRFTGALTLTNGANLVLPGGNNIQTASGDYAMFRGYASGVVRMVGFLPNRIGPKWELVWVNPLTGGPPIYNVDLTPYVPDGGADFMIDFYDSNSGDPISMSLSVTPPGMRFTDVSDDGTSFRNSSAIGTGQWTLIANTSSPSMPYNINVESLYSSTAGSTTINQTLLRVWRKTR